MKVKNIMFAGFAAAILSGACGAARAEAEAGSTVKILARKAFVEAQVDALDREKQDVITDLETIRTQAGAALSTATAADTYATKTYVGTIPAGATATDVVGYVTEKTAGIATDAALGELTGRVTTAEADIDGLQAKVGDVSVADRIATSLADYTTTANLQKDYLTKADAETTYATKTTIGDLEGHETVVAYVEGAVDAVNGGLDDVKSTVTGHTTQIDSIDGKLTTVEGVANAALPKSTFEAFQTENTTAITNAVKTETDRATAAEEALDGRVDTLETTVGNAESGLVKGVADNAAAITTLNSGADVAGSVDNKIKATADTLLNRPTTNTCGADSGLCVLTMSNKGALVWIDVTNPATE